MLNKCVYHKGCKVSTLAEVEKPNIVTVYGKHVFPNHQSNIYDVPPFIDGNDCNVFKGIASQPFCHPQR